MLPLSVYNQHNCKMESTTYTLTQEQSDTLRQLHKGIFMGDGDSVIGRLEEWFGFSSEGKRIASMDHISEGAIRKIVINYREA